jgi:hypothetical protein
MVHEEELMLEAQLTKIMGIILEIYYAYIDKIRSYFCFKKYVLLKQNSSNSVMNKVQ